MSRNLPFETVDCEREIDKYTALGKRLQTRFIKKPKAVIKLNVNKDKKLIIRYMFGAKYNIARKVGKKKSTLGILVDLKTLLEIIEREKGTESFVGRFKMNMSKQRKRK